MHQVGGCSAIDYLLCPDCVRQLMPLNKSKSKGAFKANIKTEIAAGKPQKQAVAIAYSLQRRSGGKGKKGRH